MGAKTKTKAPALAVPQNDDEADFLLRVYGEDQRALAGLETAMNAELARVKAKFETDAEPFKQALSLTFDKLRAWAEANRSRLTQGGKTKTVEMPAGKVNWRIRPPAVKFRKGIEIAEIVAAILKARLRRKFLRMKLEVNRDAMLEHPDDAKKIDGVKIVSGIEDFYVEPIGLELAEAAQ